MEVKRTMMTKQKLGFTQQKGTFSTALSPLASSCQHSQATTLLAFSVVLTHSARVRAVLLFL